MVRQSVSLQESTAVKLKLGIVRTRLSDSLSHCKDLLFGIVSTRLPYCQLFTASPPKLTTDLQKSELRKHILGEISEYGWVLSGRSGSKRCLGNIYSGVHFHGKHSAIVLSKL